MAALAYNSFFFFVKQLVFVACIQMEVGFNVSELLHVLSKASMPFRASQNTPALSVLLFTASLLQPIDQLLLHMRG